MTGRGGAAPGRHDPVAEALARLYDVDLLEDPGDVDLYLALARRADGPILELGVGTGRVAVPLAAAGFEVTGVDLDPAMLRRARERAAVAGAAAAARLDLVEADVRTVRLPNAGHYALAIVALNALLVFGDREGQQRVMVTVAEHLAPGGQAVLDVWLPAAEELGRYDGRLGLEYVRRDPDTGRLVTKQTSALYDPASGTVELTVLFDEGEQGEAPARWVRQDRLRLVGPDELAAFADAAGLSVDVVASDYDLRPLGPGHDRVILVASKPSSRGSARGP